ncbi:DinB family protein [Bacillus sp. V59.32b]|uniref:DinB family protein n=1 Tax=Bacillus sp. V59.32b TaxID=1758642 RepID=UPI000E3E74C7|nr:DinB family protein [Bacillus sp. V59.32b]RFU69607.1 hypothetical protein D0463_01890 [Bacillus sp. V59.32b]
MFLTLEGFMKSWEFESQATQKILNNLTDESLKQEITEENWTLGRIAWHIVPSIHIMTSRTGLKFEAPTENWPVPTSAQFIADSYGQVSAAFLEAIKAQWTDESLQIESDFFGQKQQNSIFLMTLILHQNHHRGQMTVLMRQAGLPVPGIYGPSKEEWAPAGMEAPIQ